MTTREQQIARHRAQMGISFTKMSQLWDYAQVARESDMNARHFRALFVDRNDYINKFEYALTSLRGLQDVPWDDSLAPDPDQETANKFNELDIKVRLAFADLPVLNENTTPRSPTAAVRLPKISLPTFSGQFEEWQSFYSLFVELIHHNPSLSSIQKFQYLNASLTGKARSAIAAYLVAPDNYDNAIKALHDRYERPRHLAVHCWEKITKLTLGNRKNALRELLDVFNENLALLKSLDMKSEELLEFILFQCLFIKLDNHTRELFERSQPDSKCIPQLGELKTFLEKQCDALDMAEKPSEGHRQKSHTFVVASDNKVNRARANGANPNCILCNQPHFLFHCLAFQNKSLAERRQFIVEQRRCFNCLGNHGVYACKSKQSCKQCHKRHHTLLHEDANRRTSDFSTAKTNINRPEQSQAAVQTNNFNTNHTLPQPPQAELSNSRQTLNSYITRVPSVALLATAEVNVRDAKGHMHKARALLDCGSQGSFITASLFNKLNLPSEPTGITIAGFGGQSHKNNLGIAQLMISSTNMQYEINNSFVIVPNITHNMPTCKFPREMVAELSNLTLADSKWHSPNKIDLLLGADLYPQLILPQKIKLSHENLYAMNSVLGWVLMGSATDSSVLFVAHTELELNESIKRFWEIESPPTKKLVSPENRAAEDLYKNTVKRLPDGRFSVALPFRVNPPILGTSRQQADNRLFAMERKFARDPAFRTAYCSFMQEYILAGHMVKLSDTQLISCINFIPHHAIFKTNSLTPSIRVVYDAAAKTSNGVSLNDCLITGPKLQLDIASLLLTFRFDAVAVTADIKQMYRQIIVHPEHRQYQLIRWRDNTQAPIDTYVLNTVTYGLSCSPFLAIRTLLHLAELEESRFPLGAHILRNCTYVDDILFTGPNVEAALQQQQQLISILRLGGFELRKWASNRVELLQTLPPEHCSTSCASFDNQDNTTKILGLRWNAAGDYFGFNSCPRTGTCTKRFILSEIARIYDPLGFLAPLTLWAKSLMQRLWTAGLAWDDAPSSDILLAWTRFQSELPSLDRVRIPRFLNTFPQTPVQIHGFSDASMHGYAAVIYFRTVKDENISVRWFFAKAKVAPLKRLSIPRLELQAAVLLSELLQLAVEFCQQRHLPFEIFAWSDSTIVLSWIRSPSYKFNVFVANRTAIIHERVGSLCWRYIQSANNPADSASRGLLPADLLECRLWWLGPSFLYDKDTSGWPPQPTFPESTSELCKQHITSGVVQIPSEELISSLLNRFSSLTKMTNITAYLFRFLHNLQNPNNRRAGPITGSEQDEALDKLIRCMQHTCFSSEILLLTRKLPVSRSLARLSPFLDINNFLRVGGRLQNAELPPASKYPLLLPAKHKLTQLIIKHLHIKYLHTGITTLQHLLQRRYWIVSARKAIRHVVFRCTICYRHRPIQLAARMADLPAARVTSSKPFTHVGVDLAGPFWLTPSKQRGIRSAKAYICLFICFTTKAVHLEVVSSQSTDAFMAALRRFVARRGECKTIYSDQGRNFIGAHRELSRLFRIAAGTERIDWKFNPPAASHFGGLWERAIQTVKHHVSRVMGEQVLTFEEFNTLICQIESVINSRPLTYISNDPNDIRPLSPGDLLIAHPMSSISSDQWLDTPSNLINRWQLIQKLHQSFWVRWRREYLHTLLGRSKWTKNHVPPPIGTVVVLQDDHVKPCSWPLALITKHHPGPDGVVRTVTVRTPSAGEFMRPIVKCAPLPPPV